jgi:hypothetical protein
MSFVYWIYDNTCEDPITDGYVGVTEDVGRRLKAHKRKHPIIKTKIVDIQILYEGSRDECFTFEKGMRPLKSIGWNSAVGGSHGWRNGFNHSLQSKAKMSAAWDLERKNALIERNKSMVSNKLGVVPHQLYINGKCLYCSFEATSSNISKWHNENCKMNPDNPKNEIGLFEYIECPHCNKRPKLTHPNSRRNFKTYHFYNCRMYHA